MTTKNLLLEDKTITRAFKEDLFSINIVTDATLSVTKVNTHSSYSCYQVRP